MNADPFTHTLNLFCGRLSERLAALELEEDRVARDFVVGTLLDAIRESIANLLLCELECERLLRREI